MHTELKQETNPFVTGHEGSPSMAQPRRQFAGHVPWRHFGGPQYDCSAAASAALRATVAGLSQESHCVEKSSTGYHMLEHEYKKNMWKKSCSSWQTLVTSFDANAMIMKVSFINHHQLSILSRRMLFHDMFNNVVHYHPINHLMGWRVH